MRKQIAPAIIGKEENRKLTSFLVPQEVILGMSR